MKNSNEIYEGIQRVLEVRFKRIRILLRKNLENIGKKLQRNSKEILR